MSIEISNQSWDVIFYDEVGVPFDGNTPSERGLGASEHQVIMLAEQLATRGRKVLVLNNCPRVVRIAGVWYAPRVFGAAPAMQRCTSLIVCRYSKRPKIEARQTIVWATDIPSGPSGNVYGHHETEILGGRATLVALSEWHLAQFPPRWQDFPLGRVIPLAVPDDLFISPIAGADAHTFVYASAALKGLRETLEAWAEMRPPDGKLRVLSPGYDEWTGEKNWPGVTFVGARPFAEVILELRGSAGLFYCNTFPETFCVTAALAEHLGRRCHILCMTGSSGFAGLKSAVDGPLITQDRAEFKERFQLALERPAFPHWYGKQRSIRMAQVYEKWSKFLKACPEAWDAPVEVIGPRVPVFIGKRGVPVADGQRIELAPDGELVNVPVVVPPGPVDPNGFATGRAQPNGKRWKLCLTMIVKDEEKVIGRALESAKYLMDCYCIVVDAATTDATEKAIIDAMGDKPGKIHRVPWRGFDGQRNEALRLAGELAEYALILDADDTLEADDDWSAEFLDKVIMGNRDEARVIVEDGPEHYPRTHIVRVHPDIGYRYQWPIHESLVLKGGLVTGKSTQIQSLRYKRGTGGAHNRDAQSFVRDAQICRDWLAKNPKDARMAYYLAQSLRDAAGREKDPDAARALRTEALEAHLARADMTYGVIQETYVSLWHAGQEALEVGRGVELAADCWLRAVEVDPRRAETLWELAQLMNGRGRRHAAQIFAAEAVTRRAPPADAFCARPFIYEWGARDQLAVALAYIPGRAEEACQIIEKLIADQPGQRERLEKNLAFARSQVAPAQKAG